MLREGMRRRTLVIDCSRVRQPCDQGGGDVLESLGILKGYILV